MRSKSRMEIRIAFVSFKANIAFVSYNRLQTFKGINRLDPSALDSRDWNQTRELMLFLHRENTSPALVDENGNKTSLPRPIFDLLVQVVAAIQEGQVITLVPEKQELTTQAAANVLGVSRPHLIKLLEAGELPFHRVGSHRRVRMKDLAAFQQRRDAQRREALNDIARRVQDAGLY